MTEAKRSTAGAPVCRICGCPASSPARRRDRYSGAIVEQCVSTDHDGRHVEEDTAAFHAAAAARWIALGLSRAPGGAL
jgi:hypothetical protein